MLLVISCSLSPKSRSRILARLAYDRLRDAGHDVRFVDLTEHPVPLCDADGCYEDVNVIQLARWIEEARGVLLGTPVYNFDASAATKNLIELTGSAWSDKVVGFLCAAGGRGSYMSVMALANSLMLDFRCLIIPRFVYATKAAFAGDTVQDPAVNERVSELANTLGRLTKALS